MGKYDPLYHYLSDQRVPELALSFRQIEQNHRGGTAVQRNDRALVGERRWFRDSPSPETGMDKGPISRNPPRGTEGAI